MGDRRTRVRIVGPDDAETLREPDGTHDRFLIPSDASGGGFALVEHLLAAHRLAAPLHRHSGEDEYTYVLVVRAGELVPTQPLYPRVSLSAP